MGGMRRQACAECSLGYQRRLNDEWIQLTSQVEEPHAPIRPLHQPLPHILNHATARQIALHLVTNAAPQPNHHVCQGLRVDMVNESEESANLDIFAIIYTEEKRKVRGECNPKKFRQYLQRGKEGEERRVIGRSGLDWIGLDWIGLDWIGLESVPRHVAWERARDRACEKW
jgi:hypothetical protein